MYNHDTLYMKQNTYIKVSICERIDPNQQQECENGKNA